MAEDAIRALQRARNEDWYRWIEARREGEHLHGLRMADGSPAACPVDGCWYTEDLRTKKGGP